MVSSRLKRVFNTLALSMLAFAALGSWAFASPVGAAPDDDYHLASIWCSWGERDGICQPGESPEERVVQERLVASATCYAFDPNSSGACDISDSTYVNTARGNFVGAYPPVFYAAMGVFASTDVALSTIVMRLVNAALFVTIVSVLTVTSRRGDKGPLIWGALLAIVPLGMFIIPSVNPSSWAAISGATLWIALLAYFRAGTRVARFLFAALSIFLAIIGSGARGDSAAYVALAAVIALILSFERSVGWVKLATLPLVVIVLGAIFFLASGQSAGVTGISDQHEPATEIASPLSAIVSNLTDLQSLWIGNLGYWGLGWLDTQMPPIVWVTVTVIFGSVAFWGLQVMDARKLIALMLVVAALIAVPMFVLFRLQVSVGQWVQPRYLLPLMFLFAGLVTYGFRRANLGLSRLQLGIVFLGLAVANSIALFRNLRRYVTGIDQGGMNLNSEVEWWWNWSISPMAVWFAGSFAFVLLLLGLYKVFQNESNRAGITLRVGRIP